MTSLSVAQDAGDADLEAAFDLKIKAEKTGDLEEVVKLCKAAIKKGLDTEGEAEAKTLAASALYELADQLRIRIQRQSDPTFFRNRAIKQLKEAVEFDPKLGEAWLLIAKLNLIRGGNLDDARSAIDQAIELMDELPQKQSEAYLLRSVLNQRDDREKSLEDLDKSIEINEGNVGALRARCTIKILQGEVDEGLADSDKIIELNEGKIDAILAQADSLARLAGTKTAAAFQLKSENEDSDGDEDTDGGEEESDSGFPAQSEEELEADSKKIRMYLVGVYDKAIELAPEREELRLRKSDIQRSLDLNDEALATIDELIEMDEESAAALLRKAQFLLTDEANDEKTIKVLDRALKIDPNNVATRNLRMRFFMARQKFSKAIKEGEKILERNPNNLDTMDLLALLYSLDEQPKKAIEIYSGLLARMPMSFLDQLPPRRRPVFLVQKIGTLRSRGDAYLSTGEHKNAIKDYEEAMDIGDKIEEMQASIDNPGFEYTRDDGVLNNLAWVLSTSTFDDLRDGKRAVELATMACEVSDYKKPHILSTLASSYAEAGDFDKAIEWIEKGLEVNAAREITEVVTEEEIKQQKESLEKELAFYRDKKPWRENQAEEDAKKKAEEARKDSDDDDSDTEDDDDEDKDE